MNELVEKNKNPLVILAGPTAVGKSSLSILLAKRIGGEVISADSMQVYRRMDIGSAKLSRSEMEGIPHHLIDICDPKDAFNIVIFQEKAKAALAEIYANGHIPIVVGGTGFYIQALLRDIDFTENAEDASYRLELETKAAKEGPHVLHEMLCAVDPKAAEEIHENNVKRTIRALEFFYLTGTPISSHNQEQRQKEEAYNACYFVLNEDRERLYQKIEQRIDEMIREGLVEEVRALKEEGCTSDMISMQGLGYKEILAWLDGKMSFTEAVELLKLNTRHFAKRQLTWFRREPSAIWVEKEAFSFDTEKILSFLLEELKKRGIWNEN